VTVATSRGAADPPPTSCAGAAQRQAAVSPCNEGESKADAARTPGRKIGPARSIDRRGSILVLHAEVGGVTTCGHGTPISGGMPTVDGKLMESTMAVEVAAGRRR
jgi:hypothetical protein